ncbi:MAG TPA: FAD-dependent monooxygenase, partial [Gemmatimonadaceae bacterium]
MADDTLDKSGRQGDALDALIVGAGPTGLTLAAQLRAFGVRFRIIDRLLDRSSESRALAVQARTLEIFDSLGLAERLIGRGRTSTRLMIHFEDRVAAAQLGVFGARDTRFPFILFVSQAETEALLRDHLAGQNVVMESGVTLTAFLADAEVVHCTLGHSDGRYEEVTTRYLIGCDGAHSTVRSGAGIPFEGGDYPEDFVLGDVEADGPIERDVLHAFAGKRAFAFFFPLGAPATWRTIALPPRDWRAADDAPVTSALSLGELQVIIDGATGGALRLHDAAWLTHFRLHHRQTAHYRSGRIFLAGDAAHIHSPVGGQGMNTGIQDAWNLGWKLALVTRGQAVARLLDSYEAERWPVGHILLRTTDRAFSLFTRVMASSAKASWFRREVASRVLPIVLSSRRLRALGFRFVSELGIRYRDSPAVAEGTPRRRNGPRAGDRLPDATVARAGLATSLHRELARPKMHLLL